MAISTMYGPGATAQTSMDLRGVDLGATPDYWSDFNRLRTRLKPPGAQAQGEALATSERDRPPARQDEYDYEPIFGTEAPTGFNMRSATGGGFMETVPGRPGIQPGFGQVPVAMGYRQVRRT